MNVWRSADDLEAPPTDPVILDGGLAGPRPVLARTLPRGDVRRDYSVLPDRLPWVDFDVYAALLATGDESIVASLLGQQLTDYAGRRATSLGQLVALREWVQLGVEDLLDAVHLRASHFSDTSYG